jgi:adenine-specific DNA-methyltransferase
MSFRYIGSKARLVDRISTRIPDWAGQGRFVDAFCGTGAIAAAAASAGWPIHLNDHLISATTMAWARLISGPQAPFIGLGGYAAATEALNELEPVQGFIWREYSPASMQHVGIERRYFRESNAGRIDAIRIQIREWHDNNRITDIEERLLIADLLSAVNRVANIAGTFGCFMAKWTNQADEAIEIRPRELLNYFVDVTVSTKPVAELVVDPADLVYLDPPYTKRQYASYYHILETVAVGDSPQVEGVSGLRPWKDLASAFCYKTKALNAIESLVNGLTARRVLLSYSDEGHVPINQLKTALRTIGAVESHIVKKIGRYQPNRPNDEATSDVHEYLFEIKRVDSAFGRLLTA